MFAKLYSKSSSFQLSQNTLMIFKIVKMSIAKNSIRQSFSPDFVIKHSRGYTKTLYEPLKFSTLSSYRLGSSPRVQEEYEERHCPL